MQAGDEKLIRDLILSYCDLRGRIKGTAHPVHGERAHYGQ